MLSIIIPTFNEMEHGLIKTILPQLAQIEGIEIIVVDGHSTDGTKEFVETFPVKLFQIHTTSRAKRLNLGIQKAKGQMLILHHPRSIIESKGIVHLRDHWDEYYWGGFTHKFDLDHPLLRFTSWYSNYIRADKRNIFYLDHCLFVRKELIEEIGLIPEVDIFEDTELSRKLLKICEGFRLDFYSLTSAIRFEKNGIYQQAFKNQILKWQYYFKVDHKKMNRSYEDKVALNAKYDDHHDS